MTPTRDPSSLSRRDFLRVGVHGVTVSCFLPAVACSGDAPADDRTAVLWLETGVCTGCACALLGSPAPTAELLIPGLRLEFQETLMEGYGSRAIDGLLASAAESASKLILVVDGAIAMGPSAAMTCLGTDSALVEYSAASLLTTLASQAAAVVALGTCASFGGIPGSGPAGSGYGSVADVTGRAVIRIPGCPPNPSWVTSALLALLRGDPIALDTLGRPTSFFGRTIHEQCPRLERFKARDFATAPGDPVRCLYQVGCKGLQAKGDCPTRLWQGRSYCIKANHPCIACTSPGFLDARATVDGKEVDAEGLAAAPFYRNRELLP